ncbi:HsdM family class I SAM-dependent methyltransferase [Pseudanabaena sp. Chao 1811]|uniref:HsdM family class I SAM-dependent methyltransferase n=1 Tax=Pseudanabaena sp. Chao 1811 TaxID=2963092 RepID=UPI0022F40634|nr:N-6 DNA methylase [Pseudanabaena sp. Chao 1811]
MSKKTSKQPPNPLTKWLALNWDRPERSYNPDVRDFLAELLRYPKDCVVTEDKVTGGYPDIKLLTLEKMAWVVGDLKKDDSELTIDHGRHKLWHQKSKYVEGLTRYVLFLTAHYLWVVLPTGDTVVGFEEPLDLTAISFSELQDKLNFLSYEQANHNNLWATFIEGQLPYIYLKLDDEQALERLRQDLQASFTELTISAEQAIASLANEYTQFQHQEQEIERNLVYASQDAQRRAKVRLKFKSDFHRHLFEEILPRFEDQYGRDINAKSNQIKERIRESFVADSVAVLVARVLFLRLVEDLELTKKRKLSNGGPRDWADFVDYLTGDAKALVQLVAEDAGRLYHEPFEQGLFDWIYETNGALDESLQRLIIRFNAYDFAGLSEEILGDIYQSFLPPAKRKRLGEFYTPTALVDWILEQTIFSHGDGKLLDPSCGSGSFLVRYVHRCLQESRNRGISINDSHNPIVRDLQTNVWGFDLNPFAAFISHFQLMWALIRFKPSTTDIPKVHIYNLNSLLKDDDLVPFLGEEFFPDGSIERDRQQWKYIVGNPPYIRAERVKYGDEMKGLWNQIWGQNADTGLVFLYRALTESLESGGWLGMVVSGGYANSEAAAKIWKLLYPNREASLRKIVWLEFAGKIWDANVIPMLLIIEKVPAQDNDKIEIYVPDQASQTLSKNLLKCDRPVKIRYKDFFDAKVSPRITDINLSDSAEGRWGNYLLPLLKPKDIPILKKLYPSSDRGKIVELKQAVEPQLSRNNRPFWFTYGIQRGGTEVTEEPTGENSVQVIAGRSISIGWTGESVGWVDLDMVRERPYGKLSLWAEKMHEKFLVVTNIGLVPTASLVTNGSIAAVDSLIIALPKANLDPKIVVTYINSKLARFYYLVRLRTGVLAGSSRAHVYPRVLEAMPWVKNLNSSIEQTLVDNYNELARLAAIAKDNPDEWLLSEIENLIQARRYRITDRILALNLVHWTAEDIQAEELRLDDRFIRAGESFLELLNADLAELVYKLLMLTAEEDTHISKSVIQKLVVPHNYAEVIQTYKQKVIDFQEVEADFFRVLARIDQTVYEMFELTKEEQAHIESRLSSFPLNKLQPRYPWQTVKPRPIKAYTSDRFV